MGFAMRRFFRNNGLSLVLFASFFVFLIGQIIAGRIEYNADREERGARPVGYAEYLSTGHFVEATMENWESEFLQMSAFVVLTVFLYQKGAADSKDPDDLQHENEGRTHGRKALGSALYENSLSATLLALFVLSFVLHAHSGAALYNEENAETGQAPVSAVAYLATSRFWFESFQNWQSEFFSIGAMTVLTIFLRQKGSPESKPLDSADSQTGSAG
jgi:hypothetical protein